MSRRRLLACAVTALVAVAAAIRPALADDEAEVWRQRRDRMVADQLAGPRDGREPILSDRVLEAMRKVPRHRFVPAQLQELAYGDYPMPIGHEQTISQPYVVALMTELADIQRGEKVLEIGTGSGYHTAVLAALTDRVFTVEILRPLAEDAKLRLRMLGYDTVRMRVGDGYIGWADEAPFDAIILTAAAPEPPAPLLEQLAPNGRLVLPVGLEHAQQLTVYTRTDAGIRSEISIPVLFVPMVGKIRDGRTPVEH